MTQSVLPVTAASTAGKRGVSMSSLEGAVSNSSKSDGALSDNEMQASLCLLKLMKHPDQSHVSALSLPPKSEVHSEGSDTEEGDGEDECVDEKMRVKAISKQLSLQDLKQHFDKPIVQVARSFGICTTLLKKICRRSGIKRWPHRQIRSLTKSIDSLRSAKCNAISILEKRKLQDQIEILERKRTSIINNPNGIGRLYDKTSRKSSTTKYFTNRVTLTNPPRNSEPEPEATAYISRSPSPSESAALLTCKESFSDSESVSKAQLLFDSAPSDVSSCTVQRSGKENSVCRTNEVLQTCAAGAFLKPLRATFS